MVAALLGGFVPLASPLHAQDGSGPPTIHIPRVSEPPRLESFLGEMGEPPPGAGARVTDFRQRKPGDGTPVGQPTTAFVSYDHANLYVVFVCKDDRSAIRANVTRREDIGDDDAVAIYLDTFHDREHAYLFMVNPLGIQLDGLVAEGQSGDYTFDAVWGSEGRLTADGYVVRLAIPFRGLRFAQVPDQTWGMALARQIRRNNEEAYWPHVTKRVKGFVPQFGVVKGLRDISPGRNVGLIPYGVLARARVLDGDAAAFRTDREERAGLDAKLVLRDALTLDATVNPDFSQVESDDPQVTVNERFEVFFPEKRPFFLENGGYFQTPINLLHSRRIVDPGLGTRLTGKLGRWALGAIALNDRDPGRRPPGDPLAGRNASVGGLRLQREVGQESTVGVLLTDREFAAGFDRAFGVDTRWKLNRNWVASAQLARSETRKLDGARSAGSGAFARIEGEGRHFEYSGRYAGFTPDFVAPLGFVRRVGFHETEQEYQYQWRPERGAVTSFGPAVAGLLNWDRSGRLQDRELAGSFEVELTGETTLEIGRVEAFEHFEGLTFLPHRTELSLETAWLKWLAVEAAYARGTAVNHDPAPGLAPSLDRATEAELNLTLRPVPRLRLDYTYLVARLDSAAGRVFSERRLRTRLAYQFNRFLSLRAIVDYEAVVPNPALTDEELERKWSADVLFTYLVNPYTAVYVGYIDRSENLAILGGESPTIERTGSGTRSIGRQLFFKLSYLLRF